MKIILAGIAALLTVPAIAQTELDSFLVQENRLQIPYSVNGSDIQIISRKDIEALLVHSVNELLAYAASTDIRQRGPWGAQADVSIDGSNFDEVLVLVNGIKLADPQTGHHKLNLPIPLAAIERIEILRGPASRIYGVNALAGAINIVTRKPAKNTAFAELFTGSSFEKDTATGATYAGWGAQAMAALQTGKQAHVFSLGHQQGNGFRYNTGYKADRIFYSNTVQLNDKHQLRALGAYTNNEFGASLFYAAPNDKEATETVQTAVGGLSWIYTPNARLRLAPSIAYRYNKDDYIYIRQKPEVYHNIHETNVVSASLDASYRIGAGTAGIGLEWRQEAINSNSLGKRDRNNIGLYAGYAYEFSARLHANAGLYLNHSSVFGTQVLPGIEAGYDLSDHWRLSANAGAGERQPTYTDLYYKGPANIGNDTLVPERALYAEAMLHYHNSFFTANFSYAYRRIGDFIDWVRVADTDPWQPQNYAAINTQVFSLRGSYDIARALKLANETNLKLNASYTYLEPTLESRDELRTKYTLDALRHKLVLSLSTLLWNKIEINAGARYQQRFNAADYWLIDARLAYHFRQFELYADGNNLFNTHYYESGVTPLPGRWFTLGLRCNLL